MDFSKLIGETAKLYSCTELHRFQLGTVIFQVNEDENDGWRSSMEDIEVITETAPTNGFLANVKIILADGDVDGFKLVDTDDNHEWLEFGTDNSDAWYPSFVFNWQPKEPATPYIDDSGQLKELIKH